MSTSHERQGSLTAVRCYYDQDRHRRNRPHCEGVATVAYGPTVLCADCDKRRSAVGRTNTARLIPGAALDRLADAAAASTDPDRNLAAAAHAARDAGASWAHIGQAVGVTRQAAQQRWGMSSTTTPAQKES